MTGDDTAVENSSFPPVVMYYRNLKDGLREKRHQKRCPTVVECDNLLAVFKLVMKELIDSSLAHGRVVDDNFVPLQHFFAVLEHILHHNVKAKKATLLSRDVKESWSLLEQVQRFCPDAVAITSSVRSMPNSRTPLGRLRAWLRLAVMQKKLADYFQVLTDHREDILVEHFEPGAIMLEEEAASVVSGLLVGLNCIDCNLCFKETDDLDGPMAVIDYSLYMTESSVPAEPVSGDSSDGAERISSILDQKNYLEELNARLGASLRDCQAKTEQLHLMNGSLSSDLASAAAALAAQERENVALREERAALEATFEKRLKVAEQDMSVERQAYQTSRLGLDQMYNDAIKKLKEETQLRQEVERRLDAESSTRAEAEMMQRLVEKDVQDKQGSLSALRAQLEEVKAINIEMYSKLQVSENSLQTKTEEWSRLDRAMTEACERTQVLEATNARLLCDLQAAEEAARRLGQQMAALETRRVMLETDLKIEKEWRSTLQQNVEKEKASAAQLRDELQSLQSVLQEHERLKEEHAQLKQLCREHEVTLADMAAQLQDSKLKVEDLKEVQQALREAHWADDSDAKTCKQCQKLFSVARRKHHCRNCGDIFCGECSDNKLPLPSSAKPVRVCDGCQEVLLQRYSAS